MSKELIHHLISRMHVKLNHIIEQNDYNLLCENVLHYSKRLDRVLSRYDRLSEKHRDSF